MIEWDLVGLLALGAVWTAIEFGVVDRVRDLRRRRDGDRGDDVDDDLEELKRKYVFGEIDDVEFEWKVGLALDEDAREVRAVLEDVPGVGPETSASIAQEFGTVDELESASREDLEEVFGVGPASSEAIREEM